MLTPVGRGQAPAVGLPGVGDLLVPAVVEDTASPIVVSQHTQPNLPLEVKTEEKIALNLLHPKFWKQDF